MPAVIFPGASLSVLQTFICKKVNTTTFLVADYQGSKCPWGGDDLNIQDLKSWTPQAWVALCFMLVYPIGVPLAMWLVLKYQRVPVLAKEKIGAALINSMITDFMQMTSDASSRRLATLIGHPPGLVMGKSQDPSSAGTSEENEHQEFDRRAEEVFREIFPEHARCRKGSCCGHSLPGMPLKFLRELHHPVDISALALEAKCWFARIDDGSGGLDGEELIAEFLKIGVDVSEVQNMLKYAMTDAGDEKLELDRGQFIGVIMYVLDNALNNFSAADVVTLGYLFEKYDEDGSGSMDIDEFKILCLDLVEMSFVFNGPESPATLNVAQVC